MKEKAIGRRIAQAEMELRYNVTSVRGGGTMRQSVPPKARRGKGKAKVTKEKDGVEKEIGVKEEKEIGVKAKEIGVKEEKDSAEKDGVKEMAEKEEENRERLRARAKEKVRRARACMSSGNQMIGITGEMSGRRRRIGIKDSTH